MSEFDGILEELEGQLIVDNGDALPQIEAPLPEKIDDFQDLTRRIGGHLEESGDEFDGFNGFYQEQRKRTAQSARGVANPATADGNSSSLGATVSLTPDVVQVSAPVARWVGEDSETGPVTVTIGMPQRLAVNGVAALRPFMFIRWGSYNAQFSAEVDVGIGRQLTVNASWIEVDAALDAIAAANGNVANLSACLSFKPMVRTSPLVRTRYLDSVVQNVPQTVTVPHFATGLLPIQMSDAQGIVQLDFYDTSNTLRYTLSISNGNQIAGIPLTGDIVKIIVTSTQATSQHIRLPFGLSI